MTCATKQREDYREHRREDKINYLDCYGLYNSGKITITNGNP